MKTGEKMNNFYNSIKAIIERLKTVIFFIVIGLVALALIPVYKTYVAYHFSAAIILAVYGQNFLAIYNLYWLVLIATSFFTRWIGLALLSTSVVVNYFVLQSIIGF